MYTDHILLTRILFITHGHEDESSTSVSSVNLKAFTCCTICTVKEMFATCQRVYSISSEEENDEQNTSGMTFARKWRLRSLCSHCACTAPGTQAGILLKKSTWLLKKPIHDLSNHPQGSEHRAWFQVSMRQQVEEQTRHPKLSSNDKTETCMRKWGHVTVSMTERAWPVLETCFWHTVLIRKELRRG